MEQLSETLTSGEASTTGSEPREPGAAFVAPRISYIRPQLTRHGNLADVTAGFFGNFSP
ncbi:MAG: lasso RiPP family leader peptide-containing protein [Acidobacteriaceae bacterium]|nr:lasso RiPP family leader peptide-containing protein [Acidobacteriaceae bacterium]